MNDWITIDKKKLSENYPFDQDQCMNYNPSNGRNFFTNMVLMKDLKAQPYSLDLCFIIQL